GCAGTCRFKDRVRTHRGGVQHVADRLVLPRQQSLQTLDDAVTVIARGGCNLVGRNPAIPVDGNQVGEGAADIDADAQRHAAGSHATFGSLFRVVRNRVRKASVAASSMSGGSPVETTP